MSYARIDDLLPHHHKIMECAARAGEVLGYYVASIAYVQRHRTDGIIRPSALPLLIPAQPVPPAEVLEALVRVKLWDRLPTKAGPGWMIHDYLEHNATAAERTARAKAAADARWHAEGIAPSMQPASDQHTEPHADSMRVASDPHAGPMPPPLLSSPLLSATTAAASSSIAAKNGRGRAGRAHPKPGAGPWPPEDRFLKLSGAPLRVVRAWGEGWRVRFGDWPTLRRSDVSAANDLIREHTEATVLGLLTLPGTFRSGTRWMRQGDAFTLTGIKQAWNDLVQMQSKGELA